MALIPRRKSPKTTTGVTSLPELAGETPSCKTGYDLLCDQFSACKLVDPSAFSGTDLSILLSEQFEEMPRDDDMASQASVSSLGSNESWILKAEPPPFQFSHTVTIPELDDEVYRTDSLISSLELRLTSTEVQCLPLWRGHRPPVSLAHDLQNV